MQPSSQLNLEEAHEGFMRALADSGLLRDSLVTVIERNAQGDIPTISSADLRSCFEIRAADY